MESFCLICSEILRFHYCCEVSAITAIVSSVAITCYMLTGFRVLLLKLKFVLLPSRLSRIQTSLVLLSLLHQFQWLVGIDF